MVESYFHFTKMHGLGNDFVLLDTISQNLKIDPLLIRRIADRHYGIGCDQVLIVEAPYEPDLDFNYRIFNADGKEVEQCGNGARCFGRYVYDQGLTDKKNLLIGTLAGRISIDLSDIDNIEVNMGAPIFNPKLIPFNAKVALPLPVLGRFRIQLNKVEREVTVLSMGNPHCVINVHTIKEAPLEEIGNLLQNHPAFPKGVNVSFIEVLARNHIKCRTFERGVGETFACGSAACAGVVCGILQKELNAEVKVDMTGGSLTVKWDGEETGAVFLSGPAKSVFQGEFCLKTREAST